MKIIAVVSMKGGVGKTTVSANLAQAFCENNHTVMAVDMDPQNALRLHFGMDPGDYAGLALAVTSENLQLEEAIRTYDGCPLYIPYGVVRESERIAFERELAQNPYWLKDFLGFLAENESMISGERELIVMIDTPPGPSVYLQQALRAASFALVVLLPDGASYATIPAMDLLLDEYLSDEKARQDSLFILNQFDPRRDLDRDVVSIMSKSRGEQMVTIRVHRDAAVPEAMAQQEPVIKYDEHSQAALDFREAATWVLSRL